MLQSKAINEVMETTEVDNWDLIQKEMESILLPTPEEDWEDIKNSVLNSLNINDNRRTCIGVIIDKKTGEITYE